MNESSNMQLHPEQDSFSLLTLEEKKTIVFVSRCVRCLENELFESPSIVVFSFLLSFSSLLCLTTYMYASISRSSVKIDI